MKTLFKIKLLKCHYCLLLMPVALWLLSNSAQADITCTASMNSGTVNISNAITPTNANDEKITGSLDYGCTNHSSSGVYASVRLGVNGGGNSTLYMSGHNSSKLAYTMTLPNGTLWGDGSSNGSEYLYDTFFLAPSETVTRSVVIQTALLSGHGNTYATEGLHINNSYITLMYNSTIDSTPRLSYENDDQIETQFPFTVQATVVASCLINSATNINLESHPANLINIEGAGRINLTCTNAMPYYVGLTPSNNRTDGIGVMISKNGKSDIIPYQLRSQPGLNGQIWGNTATATNQGNGVSDTGNGQPRVLDVYVTVPQTDVRPDTYSDVVTVTVYY